MCYNTCAAQDPSTVPVLPSAQHREKVLLLSGPGMLWN